MFANLAPVVQYDKIWLPLMDYK